MGPYGFDGGMGWDGWVAVAFALVVFVGMIAAGVVLAMRSGGHHRGLAAPALPGAALHILDERFARGEIDADEYSRRRRLLSGR